jgi:hypothetical protein
MLRVQVVAREGYDAHKLLRDKVHKEAQTFLWGDSAKTKLRHRNYKHLTMWVAGADGVVIGHLPQGDRSEFFLEKFVGRLTAWFPNELAALNIQFLEEPAPRRKKPKKK